MASWKNNSTFLPLPGRRRQKVGVVWPRIRRSVVLLLCSLAGLVPELTPATREIKAPSSFLWSGDVFVDEEVGLMYSVQVAGKMATPAACGGVPVLRAGRLRAVFFPRDGGELVRCRDGVVDPWLLRRRRIWCEKFQKMKMEVIFRSSASSAASSAVGSSDPTLGDFPLARRLTPLKEGSRSSGSGAPPTASVRRRRRVPEEEEVGPCCIFFFFLVLSVRARF